MLGCFDHDRKHTVDELRGHSRVPQVRHAVDEDKARRMPASRQVERVLVNRDAESRAAGARIPVNLVFRIPHSLEALGEGERVAVIASGADAITSCGGVPGGFGPLDGAFVGHAVSVLWRSEKSSSEPTTGC